MILKLGATFFARPALRFSNGVHSQMIFFGEKSLRRAINEFVEYYHHERNHQGLNNRLIDPLTEVGSLDGDVACRERLGGVLRYYYRVAA